MRFRRSNSRYVRAFSGLLAFALAVATVFGAIAHAGHARGHVVVAAPSADHAAHLSHAAHTANAADQSSAIVNDDAAGNESFDGRTTDSPVQISCGDLFCHGALLVTGQGHMLPLHGRDARNDLLPPNVSPAAPSSLERPPRATLRA